MTWHIKITNSAVIKTQLFPKKYLAIFKTAAIHKLETIESTYVEIRFYGNSSKC